MVAIEESFISYFAVRVRAFFQSAGGAMIPPGPLIDAVRMYDKIVLHASSSV